MSDVIRFTYDINTERSINDISDIYDTYELLKNYFKEPVEIKDVDCSKSIQRGENKGLSNPYIMEFMQFISKPEHITKAISMILWIDTFHDFKVSRNERTQKYNDLINTLIFFYKEKNYHNNININENSYSIDPTTKKYNEYCEDAFYTISTIYRDSFYDYTKMYKIGNNNKFIFPKFNDGVKNTILKECYEYDKTNHNICARILYQMSLVVMNYDFEEELLYSYILLNFFNDSEYRFYINKDKLIDKLRKILHTSFSEEMIPYYSRDTDIKKSIKSLEKGYQIILPASIMDANKQNSSSDPTDFTNLKTIIKYACKEDLTYEFIKNDCILNIYDDPINNNENFLKLNCICNSSECSSIIKCDENIYNIEKKIDSWSTKSIFVKEKFKNEYIDKNYFEKYPSVKDYYKDKKLIRNGFSVDLIYQFVIRELYDKQDVWKKGTSGESRYTTLDCEIFDKIMCLKRLGDYGQIMQCKQLNIPLFTDDNMQILVCLITRTSVVWSPVDKLLFYKGTNTNNKICVNNKIINNKYENDLFISSIPIKYREPLKFFEFDLNENNVRRIPLYRLNNEDNNKFVHLNNSTIYPISFNCKDIDVIKLKPKLYKRLKDDKSIREDKYKYNFNEYLLEKTNYNSNIDREINKKKDEISKKGIIQKTKEVLELENDLTILQNNINDIKKDIIEKEQILEIYKIPIDENFDLWVSKNFQDKLNRYKPSNKKDLPQAINLVTEQIKVSNNKLTTYIDEFSLLKNKLNEEENKNKEEENKNKEEINELENEINQLQQQKNKNLLENISYLIPEEIIEDEDEKMQESDEHELSSIFSDMEITEDINKLQKQKAEQIKEQRKKREEKKREEQKKKKIEQIRKKEEPIIKKKDRSIKYTEKQKKDFIESIFKLKDNLKEAALVYESGNYDLKKPFYNNVRNNLLNCKTLEEFINSFNINSDCSSKEILNKQSMDYTSSQYIKILKKKLNKRLPHRSKNKIKKHRKYH
jgi:hypothetical protein